MAALSTSPSTENQVHVMDNSVHPSTDSVAGDSQHTLPHGSAAASITNSTSAPMPNAIAQPMIYSLTAPRLNNASIADVHSGIINRSTVILSSAADISAHEPPPPYTAARSIASAPAPPMELFEVDLEAQTTVSSRPSLYNRLADTHKRFKHSITIGSAIITLAIFSLELWSNINELAES